MAQRGSRWGAVGRVPLQWHRSPCGRGKDTEKQLGPERLQNTLMLRLGAVHMAKPLYTRRASPERQAVEGVPVGPPQPPHQRAQGPSAGMPLPQLRMVQGVAKPTPLAVGISSSHREPQVGSDGAGTLCELGHTNVLVSGVQVGAASRLGWESGP